MQLALMRLDQRARRALLRQDFETHDAYRLLANLVILDSVRRRA